MASAARKTIWGLLTPSGIVVPTGREHVLLTRAERADGWKAVVVLPRPSVTLRLVDA